MGERIAGGTRLTAWALSVAAGLATSLMGAPTSRPATGPAAALDAFRDESNRVHITWKVSLWELGQTGFALTRRVVESDGRKGPWKTIGPPLHQPNFSDDWLAQNKLDHVIKQKPKLKTDRIDTQKIIAWFIESPKDLAMTGGMASSDIQWSIAFGMGWIDEAPIAGSVYEYSLARAYEGNKTGAAIADFLLPAGVAKLRAPKVEEFTTGRTRTPGMVALQWRVAKAEMSSAGAEAFAVLRVEPDGALTEIGRVHTMMGKATADGKSLVFSDFDDKAGRDSHGYAVAYLDRRSKPGLPSVVVIAPALGGQLTPPVALKAEITPEGVRLSWQYDANLRPKGFGVNKSVDGKSQGPPMSWDTPALGPDASSYLDKDIAGDVGKLVVYGIWVISGDERENVFLSVHVIHPAKQVP